MARPVHHYTYGKKSQSIAAWAAQFGIPEATLYARVVRNGWDMKRALTTPVRPKRKSS